MKIQVEDSLFIESDGMQFILKKYSGSQDKNGNDVYKALGYFGKLEAAMDKIIKLKLMESNATTLKDLIQDLRRIEREVKTLITGE